MEVCVGYQGHEKRSLSQPGMRIGEKEEETEPKPSLQG